MIKRPNFIIGGTAAGGTSFLAAILFQHPEIYLPAEMRPEPHYYYKSWEYKKGLDYYSSLEPEEFVKFVKKEYLKEYEEFD